ncbi:MAG: hypothetical protein NC399_07405 [Muribaculum sp.]|nr:hypothetical protein [Muribaculum sp.]
MADKISGKDLAIKYRDFVNPRVQVSVGGQKITPGEGCTLEKVEITSSMEREPDMAVVVYRIWFEADARDLERYIRLGEKIEIQAGYRETLTRVFLGYLHEIWVCENGSKFREYTLICLDVKGLMKKNSSFQASGVRRLQQILTEILDAKDYGELTDKKRVDTLPESLNQECVIRGETHYDWLCGLADKLGYVFYCDRGELVFGELQGEAADTYELTREYGLYSIRTSATLAGQTGIIEVNAYNRRDQTISGRAEWPGVPDPFCKTTKKSLKNFRLAYWDMELETKEQADSLAKAYMDRMVRKCARMEITHIGIPELRPGVKVSVAADSASDLSGEFYVDETVHLLDENGYRTVAKGIRR